MPNDLDSMRQGIPQNMLGFKEILKAESIIINDNNPNSSYDKSYIVTNENKRYLEQTVPDNAKNACVILSSGDSIFELLLKGLDDITAIDVNELQRMIYELKKASILSLSPNDFENFLVNAGSKKYLSKDIFKTVSEAITDESVYNYWNYLFLFNDSEKLNSFLLRKNDFGDTSDITKIRYSLSFLKRKFLYFELRKKLENAKVQIVIDDIISFLGNHQDLKFDYIDLSNTLLFIYQINCQNDINKFRNVLENVKKIFLTNLNSNGTFVLDYLYNPSSSKIKSVKENFDEKKLRKFPKEIYELVQMIGNIGISQLDNMEKFENLIKYELEKILEIEEINVSKIFNIDGKPNDTVLLARKRAN